MDLKQVNIGITKRRPKKRVGRGVGSKMGVTSNRGSKGQRSRKGHRLSLLKEGGQMPLFQRVPKRGFNNQWRLRTAVVNVVDLCNFDPGTVVTLELLKKSGLAKHPHDRLKILGDGEFTLNLEVQAHSFSKSAVEKIEKAGGKVVVIPMTHVGPKVKNKMRPRPPKQPLQ